MEHSGDDESDGSRPVEEEEEPDEEVDEEAPPMHHPQVNHGRGHQVPETVAVLTRSGVIRYLERRRF